MNKFSGFITKHKNLITLIALLLLIPAGIGYLTTKVNYDILCYLPNSLETVEGQDIMVDDYGSGAFSMLVVENMTMQQCADLKDEIKKVDHIKTVLWYNDALDITVPKEMLPKKYRDALFNGDATMMIVMFDNTTSAETTMNAVEQIRKITGEKAFLAGMAGVVTDIKGLVKQEMPIYVAIAATLSLCVLWFTMDSFLTPVLFLLTIGISIVYNLGTNKFLGDVSYLTKALAAILQLAVTMDYSIFLLESYEAYKEKYEGDKQRAMRHAINATFKSISSSSVTTVAGFLALCVMTYKLGTNIGIVMSKGVIIGVFACVTLLPAMILTFDKGIERTTHKPFMPNLDNLSGKIVKYPIIALVIFAVVLVPALHGNSNYSVYYNIASALPKDLQSAVANEKLEKEFNLSNVHVVLLKEGLSSKEIKNMTDDMEDVDGVRAVLGLNTVVGSAIPDTMIPKSVKEIFQKGGYEMMFIISEYESATPESNSQIAKLQKIVKDTQKDAMVIGEAPLMRDLEDVTNTDLTNVNLLSIAAIFIIIMITFKSISIPVILVSVIEFAIACNMAVPYYMNTPVSFVACIVIGTIQLGATVDYAILMTNRYQKERIAGADKKTAIGIAHKTSIKSIVTSALCFFAATFGVSCYSEIDMISQICAFLSRGAIISMVVVIVMIPAMLWLFDGVIKHTSLDMIKAHVK